MLYLFLPCFLLFLVIFASVNPLVGFGAEMR